MFIPNSRATDIDYSYIGDQPAPADGVTLYISHGYVRAEISHARGTCSQITFYPGTPGRWSTNWLLPNKRQRRALDRLARALCDADVSVGNTAHHLVIETHRKLSPATVRSIAARMGLDAVKVIEGGIIDGVSVPGAYIRWVDFTEPGYPNGIVR